MSDEIKNQDEVTEASAPVANKGVVTPEKDPEKSSLASVDKAADSTKPSKKRKGDKDQKDKPQKLSAGYHGEESESDEETSKSKSKLGLASVTEAATVFPATST